MIWIYFASLIWLAPTAYTEADEIALAQVIVSEAASLSEDWEESPDEIAILAVLKNVSKLSGPHCSISCAARQYAPGTTGKRAPRTDREAWLQGLGREVAPTGYYAAWQRVRARARALLQYGGALPLPESPEHWGNKTTDRARAKKMGFRLLPCSGCRNDFYRLK